MTMTPTLAADLAATAHDWHLVHLRWAQALEARRYAAADRYATRHAACTAKLEHLHRITHT